MKRPCVALDVSKGSSHYQGWINEDKKLGNPKKIEHNQEGFREILAKAKELEGITNEKPIVVFEATGGLSPDSPTLLGRERHGLHNRLPIG